MIKRIGLILILLAICLAQPAMAAKKRVWTTVVVGSSSGGSGTPGVSARLSGWKQYLNLSFRGVSNTNGINYELIFNGNDNEQGVFGSVKPSEGNTTRSIFLGTCSHGACTAYRNINSLKLTITYSLKNGQELVKRYRVRY
jgi:hypothetical protein